MSSPGKATRHAFAAALDPARSAVVEACAGSGKTWLLASRIVRLLLAGVPPAEILAITFTRKAAREIEERVVDWLRELAVASDDTVRRFLVERDVASASDPATLACARGLYERVTTAQPGLAVNTFHGWFLQLVAVAPLSAKLAGATLADDGSRRFEELWQSFARQLQRAVAAAGSEETAVASKRVASAARATRAADETDETDGSGENDENGENDEKGDLGAASAFVRLLDRIGLAGTRALVRNGMARRAEWLAFAGDAEAPVALALDNLRALSGVGGEGDALAAFFATVGENDIRACAGILLAGNKTESTVGNALLAALALPPGEARFGALRQAALTRDDAAKKLLVTHSKAMSDRLGAVESLRMVALYGALVDCLQTALARQVEERNLALNRDALTVLHAFLRHLDAFKAERRQIDFVDAEWRVLQLLQDDSSAAFIQARLDARYRHVLLDEFQDTNPLQWQILLAWLGAYTDAQRPTVFLVGDPKQSIYRFRRAEPRLFVTAADFLACHFAAARLAQDATRRNAGAIVDVINALFADEARFAPFREQTSLVRHLPGRVELLPLFAGEAAGDDEGEGVNDSEAREGALRNPLHEPATERIDLRRRQEAEAVAARLSAMVGRTLIRAASEGEAGSAPRERPLRYGDVLLLVRKRAQIAVYEQALAAAGIPFVAASRGGLLGSLEVRDLVALLSFLVTPMADLPLAHALKSPIFACSDDDLLQLAARSEAGWQQRLRALVAEGGAGARLTRAARLLDDWIVAAAHLPAHDLLDRIFHEGEVPARYRLAVPAVRRAAAQANLEALLLLALDLDGGRYPSLPRFIDELNALAKAEGDDAPDEGELAADDFLAADGRVRIMTIHGAKGLEAPLVWLLDANASPAPERPWEVLVGWAPEAPAPQHFSFVGRKDERGNSRRALFEAEAAAAEREELNLLYVAVTRAQQLFFASGIVAARGADPATPYARLQAALQRLGNEGAHGMALPEAAAGGIDRVRSAAAALPPPSLPAVGERREAPDEAARFGILLHALLERSTAQRNEGISQQHQGGEWWRPLGFSDAELARVRPIAERLLAAPPLRRFFDPNCYQRAWNEMEITDHGGAVLRLDRLVEDAEAYWVLDYKSSGGDTPRIDDYRDQVAGYCRAVAAIFGDKPVRGALVFADASLVEVFT